MRERGLHTHGSKEAPQGKKRVRKMRGGGKKGAIGKYEILVSTYKPTPDALSEGGVLGDSRGVRKMDPGGGLNSEGPPPR